MDIDVDLDVQFYQISVVTKNGLGPNLTHILLDLSIYPIFAGSGCGTKKSIAIWEHVGPNNYHNELEVYLRYMIL